MQSKIEKYKNIEKMINDFDKKIGGEEDLKEKQENKNNQRVSLKERNKTNKNYDNNLKSLEMASENSQKGKYLNNKRPRKTSEEILKEKEEKLIERKKTFRKLNKKTHRGQPVMKYQMEHIFNKIKNKIQKGII